MDINQDPHQPHGPHTRPNNLTPQPHPPHAQWTPAQFQNAPFPNPPFPNPPFPNPPFQNPQVQNAPAGGSPTKRDGITNPTFYSIMAAAAVAVIVAAVVVWTNLTPTSTAASPDVVQAGAAVDLESTPPSVSTSSTKAAQTSSAAPPAAPSAPPSPAVTHTETAIPPTVTVTAAPPPVTVTAAPVLPTTGGTFGDLGLSIAMSTPACDGAGVVFLFASVTPGQYASEIQRALNQYPGASYLRTDQTCSSLHQTRNGNPIYAVYVTAGYDQKSVCSTVYAAGGDSYGKWLNNTTDPHFIIAC